MAQFSTGQRKKLAKTGAAMPGGRYPIRNATDLENAERAVGRTPPAGRPAVRAHIRSRAKALGIKPSPGAAKSKAKAKAKAKGKK